MDRRIGRRTRDGTRAGRALLAAALGVAVLLSGLPFAAQAGTTGKIGGRILDKKKQPLAGVNVVVPVARTGAVTDADGRYVVLNVSAGIYEVKVALLGYRGVVVQNVRVSADNTTALDLELEESPVEMKEVVVSAKRPVVDIKLTSNLAAMHRDEIQKLPLQDLEQIVNLQAGVVDGHVRGGRKGEVQYQVDGVTINNPYDNKSSLRLDRSLLEEVQVISGTFDAEYGQAMSGVVNAVLRRGTDRFQWGAELFSGGFLFEGAERRPLSVFGSSFVPAEGTRPVDFFFRPAGIQNYQLNLSGPTGLPKTTFLVNARRYSFDDYVMAERRFSPWAVADTDTVRRLPPAVYKAYFDHDGDGGREPLGYSREWSGVAKLSNRSLRNIELSYQAIANVVTGRRTNFGFRYNPDGLSTQRTRSVVHGLDLTHTLSRTTFYNLALRQNWFDYLDVWFEDLADSGLYAAAGPPRSAPGYELDAYTVGADLGRFRQTTNAVVVKGSVVSQWRKDQQLKAGAEFQWPHVKFGAPGEVVDLRLEDRLQWHVDDPPKYPGVLEWRPYTAAGYAQEEIEWNDLRIRAGLRLEYFNPRAMIPGDLKNPANSIDTIAPLPPVATTRKVRLAPRIGVSYPVTSKAALFFAYGHMYQMPELGKMYDKADYGLLTDLQAGIADYGRIMGNPDIRPEKTVQYQFGYKQAVTEDFGVDVTLFYKDIRDLLGVEFIETWNQAVYARYTNVDFGNVVGFTLALNRRNFGMVDASLDYTWQLAQGNSSDPRETADRAKAGEDPRPRSVPFSWDQRHTLNLTTTLSRPGGFSVSSIVRMASGQPFTPALAKGFGSGLESNSGRKPKVLIVDLRGEQSARLAGMPVSLFARVFNLLDAKFNNGFVFDTSGSPYYSRFLTADQYSLADPTRLYAPRRIEVGLTLRSAGRE